ncbi:MAG: amidase, partial [Acidobacteria bacterium]|nr:amidase [Acidobacteriota bacterium]
QEFAFGVSGDNPTFGRTRNPHDPARIPGGSSSGSAVAVATGAGFGSVGTDTGGSIRIPASLNGVFGLKPSYGAVPRAGVTPLSWSLDHVGPIARSAGDIEVLFGVLSGRSSEPVTTRAADSKPLANLRVGIPLDFFYTDLTREARQAASGIVDALLRLGAERVEVKVPEVELSGVCRNVLAFAEAAVVHRERLATRPPDISEDVRRLLEVGEVLSATDLLTALQGRRLVTGAFTRLFEAVDVLVVPSTPAGAPEAGEPLATGEDIRAGLIRLVGPFNFTGLPALSAPAGFDALGMPLGAQLVGGPGQDFAIIRLAAWLEASGAVRMRQPPPRPPG